MTLASAALLEGRTTMHVQKAVVPHDWRVVGHVFEQALPPPTPQIELEYQWLRFSLSPV
jgi:hypothetical protein